MSMVTHRPSPTFDRRGCTGPLPSGVGAPWAVRDIPWVLMDANVVGIGDASLVTSDHDNLESLCRAVHNGEKYRFLFFWRPNVVNPQQVGKECLSQWYQSPFSVDGHTFPTAEHYMMFQKAILFQDLAVAEQILMEPSPRAVRTLGRKVHNFESTIWEQQRSSIVIAGNQEKFSQSPSLREFLVDTKEQILVEASPVDRVWGIGLAEEDENAENPLLWRGLNLLGFALMAVRGRLR
jgi:ribA/ribD-fused uncharacterized protein